MHVREAIPEAGWPRTSTLWLNHFGGSSNLISMSSGLHKNGRKPERIKLCMERVDYSDCIYRGRGKSEKCGHGRMWASFSLFTHANEDSFVLNIPTKFQLNRTTNAHPSKLLIKDQQISKFNLEQLLFTQYCPFAFPSNTQLKTRNHCSFNVDHLLPVQTILFTTLLRQLFMFIVHGTIHVAWHYSVRTLQWTVRTMVGQKLFCHARWP
jgi:hypothetical protein